MTQTVILRGDEQREFAKWLIEVAPVDYAVVIKEPTRTDQQNNKLWPMIADVRRAQPEGRRWIDETWKCGFMALAGHQMKFEMGLDGTGAFPLGFKSSQLPVRQFSELITVIYEYGDRHGVQWSGHNQCEVRV